MVLAMGASSWSAISLLGARAARPTRAAPSPRRHDRVDAIVVHGCRVLASGRVTGAASRRVAAAAAAYRDGIAPRVVASGGRRWGQQIEARVLGSRLVDAGVPEDAIALEMCSLSTRENALFAAAILRRIGARSAAVVTCPWHMARALANFEQAGIAAVAIPAHGPAAGLVTAIRRRIHEVLGGWLDTRAARGRALAEAAGWIA